MSKHSSSTRRMFLKCGALLAGPIAAVSLPALALTKERPEGGLQARVARLEDEAAIREVHQAWLRQINAGGGTALIGASVTRVSADHAGVADRIDIAEDGRRATGRFDCEVEVQRRLPDDFTLGQMAHAQGSGTLRTTERRVLTVEYLKVAGAWTMGRICAEAG
ncbi:MAG TPA: hypothetical protein VK700_01745 [Steroidobacteraceae bacterium]|jgi:hypothetical protein|nr:hypothetical protein [Steroidobacteraceae bacterium]